MPKIKNDTEHAIALSCVSELMRDDPDIETEEGQALVELAHAVEQYEKKRWPLKTLP